MRSGVYYAMGRRDPVDEEVLVYDDDHVSVHWPVQKVQPDPNELKELLNNSVPALFEKVYPAGCKQRQRPNNEKVTDLSWSNHLCTLVTLVVQMKYLAMLFTYKNSEDLLFIDELRKYAPEKIIGYEPMKKRAAYSYICKYCNKK